MGLRSRGLEKEEENAVEEEEKEEKECVLINAQCVKCIWYLQYELYMEHVCVYTQIYIDIHTHIHKVVKVVIEGCDFHSYLSFLCIRTAPSPVFVVCPSSSSWRFHHRCAHISTCVSNGELGGAGLGEY